MFPWDVAVSIDFVGQPSCLLACLQQSALMMIELVQTGLYWNHSSHFPESFKSFPMLLSCHLLIFSFLLAIYLATFWSMWTVGQPASGRAARSSLR